MYKVQVILKNKKAKKQEMTEFLLGAMDTPEYNDTMSEIADALFDMDIKYNDIDGDGDMVVDDMLIAISEEEDFERQLSGIHCDYIVCGKQVD